MGRGFRAGYRSRACILAQPAAGARDHTGFVGYRFTEIDLDDEKDRELEQAAQIGVRLGI